MLNSRNANFVPWTGCGAILKIVLTSYSFFSRQNNSETILINSM